MSIAFVQSDSRSASSVSSLDRAFPSDNTSGNFIYVAVNLGVDATTCTISDTLGNTYVQIDHIDGTGTSLWHFYAKNVAPGANTVTVTPGSATNIRFAIAEYSGVHSTSPVDVYGQSSGTGTSMSVGAITTNYNNTMLLAPFRWTSAQTFTAGTNYTDREHQPPSPLFAYEDFISGNAAGSETATATIGASANWTALIVAIREATSDILVPGRSFRIHEYTYEA